MSFGSLYAPVTMSLGALGILLNMFLLAIIYRCSRVEPSKMNIFAALKSVVDIAGAAGALMSAFPSILQNGFMIMPTMGLAQYLPHPADIFFLDLGITLNCILPLSTICPIIYRYLLFVRSRDLKSKEAYIFFIVVMVFGVIGMRLKLITYYLYCPMTAAQALEIRGRLVELKHENPNFDGSRYFIASTESIFHRCGITFVFALAGFCGAVTVFCSAGTLKALSASRHVMSEHTLLMHRRIQRMLIAQAGIPVIFAGTPLIGLEACYYLNVSWPLWITALCMWSLWLVYVLNPLVVFILTPAYRRILFSNKNTTDIGNSGKNPSG